MSRQDGGRFERRVTRRSATTLAADQSDIALVRTADCHRLAGQSHRHVHLGNRLVVRVIVPDRNPPNRGLHGLGVRMTSDARTERSRDCGPTSIFLDPTPRRSWASPDRRSCPSRAMATPSVPACTISAPRICAAYGHSRDMARCGNPVLGRQQRARRRSSAHLREGRGERAAPLTRVRGSPRPMHRPSAAEPLARTITAH